MRALEERIRFLEGWSAVLFAVMVFLPITLSWIALITGIVLSIARLFITYGEKIFAFDAVKKAWFSILSLPLTGALLTFTVFVALSGLLAGGIPEAWGSIVTLRTLIVYFWAALLFTDNQSARNRAICALFLAGAMAGIVGAVQQLFDISFKDYNYLQGTGFVGEPMTYAGQMEVVGALCLAFLLTGKFKVLPGLLSDRRIFSLFLFLNLAGVLFSAERSAWLGFLIASLVMTALVSRKIFISTMIILPAILVLIWLTVPVVQKRFENIASDRGMQARLVVWKVAAHTWQENLLFGVGARNFPRIHIPDTTPDDKPFDHAHNNILHIGTTLGVMGLLSYLWLCLAMILKPFLALRSSSKSQSSGLERAVCLGVLGGVLSLTVAGFFEYNFGTGHVRLMEFFVFAFLGADRQEQDT